MKLFGVHLFLHCEVGARYVVSPTDSYPGFVLGTTEKSPDDWLQNWIKDNAIIVSRFPCSNPPCRDSIKEDTATTAASTTTTEVNSTNQTCPETHPFAYYSGRYCCKTNKEIPLIPGIKPITILCDGGEIGIDSICCEDNNFTLCFDPPCRDSKK
jgi:hypothetical protein